MDWNTLLSTTRQRSFGKNTAAVRSDLRSEFEKDYHRIIGSASFRRLQDKTQVFPLDQSDFIRTRLTHSIEVSSFARSLGQNIGESIIKEGKDPSFTIQMKEDISHILECAGLIHDIGNPPFGHFGELSIREWFVRNLPRLQFSGRKLEDMLTPQMKDDFYHFEGNAQAFRLVTRLHYLVDDCGMNLTFALLNTIIKYPVSSLQINKTSGNIKDKKIGYFYADHALFEMVSKETGAGENRHPLTYILEAADDLAYNTADIEDAFIKGYLNFYDLKRELAELNTKYPNSNYDALERLESLYQYAVTHNEKDPESYAVRNWIVRIQGYLLNCATHGFIYHYDEIMAGTYTKDIFHGTFGECIIELLGDIANRYVFITKDIYKMEVKEQVIMDFLMNKFVHASLYYDTNGDLDSLNTRMLAFFPDNYMNAYRILSQGKPEGEKLYLRLLLVTDYVCGMTDSYAKRLYQELTGII